MQSRHFKRVNITLPPGLLKALDDYALTYGSTRSGVIQTALHDWLYIQKQYEPSNGVIKHQTKKRKALPSPQDQGVLWKDYWKSVKNHMGGLEALKAYESQTYEDEV